MALEIDMLSVGNADAIIVQIYDSNFHKTILIDGGNGSDGEAVVKHIRGWAGGKIDLLVNTHPDGDHVDGLTSVVKELPVYNAWIHEPSCHRQDIKTLMLNYSRSSSKAAREVYKSLAMAGDLINLLDSRRIPRTEPFTGVSYSLPDNAYLTVVGPTVDLYTELLSGIDEAVQQAEQAEMKKLLLSQPLWYSPSVVKSQTPEQVIDEKDEESPSNNSSAILLLTYHNQRFLFTADAGPIAFKSAIKSYDITNLNWMQVPHHGSRRNLTSGLIAYFSPNEAMVSAKGGDDEKHPNANTIQALKNAGATVYGTFRSGPLWLHRDTPHSNRQGYTTATPL